MIRGGSLVVFVLLVVTVQVAACGNGEGVKANGDVAQQEVQLVDQSSALDGSSHDGSVADAFFDCSDAAAIEIVEESLKIDTKVETTFEVLEVDMDGTLSEIFSETIIDIDDVFDVCDEEAWASDYHEEWYQPSPPEAGPAPYDENCIPVINKDCSTVCDCKWVRVLSGCVVVGASLDVPWSYWEYLGKAEGVEQCVLGMSCGVGASPSEHTLMCKDGQCFMEGNHGDLAYQYWIDVLVYGEEP